MVSKYLIIIPTYNESESIVDLLNRIEKFRSERDPGSISVLIVDDNSPDKTADLVASLNMPNIDILRRPGKGGLGPAYLAGFAWGLARDFDFFLEMDADGSHLPEDLPKMLAASASSDLVIGSRWVPGGQVVNWPRSRQWISKLGTWYAGSALHLPYKDLTSGFRVFSRAALLSLPFAQIQTRGYGFQVEMAMRVHDLQFRIIEVPITFVERAAGRSKMTKEIVFEAWKMVTIWGVQRLFQRT
ncbi:MAG: polyprenol monophosphomannose synthase [Actinomycetes bacterium]